MRFNGCGGDPTGNFFRRGRVGPGVPASLPVELNRDRTHEIRVVDSFETDGPFALDLVNEGQSVHVYVNLDDDLSRVATLDGGNRYVESGSTEHVPVSVEPVDEPVTGHLEIATGYGAETADVAVTVQPWEDRSSGVEVDEDLATPGQAETADETSSGPSLPLLALVGVVVAVAVVVGYYAPRPPVLVGVGLIVGAALTALAFSLR